MKLSFVLALAAALALRPGRARGAAVVAASADAAASDRWSSSSTADTINVKEVSPLCVAPGESDGDGDDSSDAATASATLRSGNVGCVSQDLIPARKTYPVQFQSDTSGKTPDICWKTCQLVYPNTSLALVSFQSSMLDCHCGLSDSLESSALGPDLFCQTECSTGELCGGKHVFKNKDGGDFELQYFSIYCIPMEGANFTVSNVSAPLVLKDPITKPATSSSSLGVSTRASIEELLNNIWWTIMQTNIVSIIMIGLLILVIILILILLVWAYLFMENYDPQETAAFYRRLSEARKPVLSPRPGTASSVGGVGGVGGPGGPGTAKELPPDYGATNRAFDPTPDDLDGNVPEIFVDSPHADPLTHRGPGDADSAMAGPEPADLDGGNSTFYSQPPGAVAGSGGDDNNILRPGVRDDDNISQESVETEMADEYDDEYAEERDRAAAAETSAAGNMSPDSRRRSRLRR